MNGDIVIGLAYFLIPLALTVLIEALIGVLFGISKTEQRALFLINVVTNLSVNLLLYAFHQLFSHYGIFAVVFLEIAVVFTEWLLLKKLGESKRSWLIFSLVCNAASFGAGLVLSLILF